MRLSINASFGIIFLLCLLTSGAAGQERKQKRELQVVDRERPAEWQMLVRGGRFMDRYLPMSNPVASTDEIWGAENVVPRDVHNGIEDPKWSYWGGNTRAGADGKFHLLVCRWPENAAKGHMSWHDSQVVHASSKSPFGPFEVQQVIGPGHNPEWFVTDSGKHVLYTIDRRYTAESVDGPWTESDFEFDSRDRKTSKSKQRHYLHNGTFARREDGSFMMVNRHGQVWFSKDGLSSFHRVNDCVYPKAEGKYEDPCLWRTSIQYHLIVNDWKGRIAWHLRSKDGLSWKVDSGEAYMPGIAVHKTGVKEDWFKYERVKMLQDKHGRAYAANFAVIDVLKHDDLADDNHSSKLITIPMLKGRLLEVVNTEALGPDTKKIRVRIRAEDGFDPARDVDATSLRFGAPEEVDFGRGCKLQSSQPDGDDLILVFDGDANGFADHNFAGKLIGKTKDGQLLFGYSRLPGINYSPPILSARLPVVEAGESEKRMKVEVQNFGQTASLQGKVTVFMEAAGQRQKIGSGDLAGLQPFEKTSVTLPVSPSIKTGRKYQVIVRTECPNVAPEELIREMVLVTPKD